MFSFFRKKYETGLLLDPRSLVEKEKDYKAEEVVCFAPVEWKEKPQNEWRKFEIFNQNGAGSCVANAVSKVLGIENYLEENKFVRLSARDIYSRRANKPNVGMWFQDACEIAKNYGATLEQLMPSEGTNEQQANDNSDRKPSFELIAKIYKAKNYFVLPFDIDKIASIISTGKGVLLGFSFYIDEWDRPMPVILKDNPPYFHALTGVDYFLYNGVKAILIEDSWGRSRGIDGQRIITEDWFQKRCIGAYYFEDLSNLEILNSQLEKPQYEFKNDLIFGTRNYDVAQPQRCLGYLKDENGYLFPLATPPTAYFGHITQNAVKRYQKIKGLPITGRVNFATRGNLNLDFKK